MTTDNRPTIYEDVEALVDTIVERLGRKVVVGLPLGLGKANHIINALYKRAKEDSELSLSIYTALTLEAPKGGSNLEQRFLAPIAERLFDDYPALDYAKDLRAGTLPENVQVRDFFLQPGRWLNSDSAQQAHISVNYTHALDNLLQAGVNLILQLVSPSDDAKPGKEADRYSLSCNPDISADLLRLKRLGRVSVISVGQVNSRLPFLGGQADRPASDFDYILHGDNYEFPLFMPPHKPVPDSDYAIGLHAASLIPDGGTLQIGIGSTGDAISQALILRQLQSPTFNDLLDRLNDDRPAPLSKYRAPFSAGLYGLTEMVVEGFLKMIQAKVIKRQVDGALVHGAFFVGSPVFYQVLEELGPELRAKIQMMPVSFTNQLYGDEMHKREGRTGARFINSAMKVTLNGAVVSDGLEDGRVVSGVGGQYNFVSQAFALNGARSVITVPATRTKAGKVTSNIIPSYGHTTIPRHLRDIVITEYGIADLRGKSDAEVIAALLNITDSRFQMELLQGAKKAGKLPREYQIPDAFCVNTPERVSKALEPAREAGQLPHFPLGSGLTQVEEHLAAALAKLAPQVGNKTALMQMVFKGLRREPTERMNNSLERMQLARPSSMKERLYRALLLANMDE
ncbi:acetyl-CoA hydrolase/transferase C-terminal domain-containing protein [Marinimicrobium sp. ABcell2]|uniref:acetyl-CoA hydrolase/transferase C-terminal domain-containing protein n=1 Tax=Marinimicrobium sp. ABcell2 TaxID=3069751 RepID=UPI0027B56813|nr:acetyl-CoA hydrolase/transferase C-terminal domain-containing protein [Marinimicrobium sp. ABcell2]MDQ2077772.1 acetyl-CoA hydrolase/transferase C-terminal domain-containing protein [Marinimicrobium sp. ABcell2]